MSGGWTDREAGVVHVSDGSKAAAGGDERVRRLQTAAQTPSTLWLRRPGGQDVTDYSLTAMLGVVTWAAGRSGRSAWSWWRRSGTCSAGSCRHRCAAQSG